MKSAIPKGLGLNISLVYICIYAIIINVLKIFLSVGRAFLKEGKKIFSIKHYMEEKKYE